MLFIVDFRVARNEDWFETFKLTDGEKPIDLTDADLKMDVRFGDDLVLTMRLGAGLDIVEAADGRFKISVPQSELAPLLVRQYTHDLLLVRDGKAERVWKGALYLEKGVTVA